MAELNRLTSIPYSLELRDTIAAALFRLDELEDAAVEIVRLDEELEAQLGRRERLDPGMMAAKGSNQTKVFDNLEAFLAAWARVSLLFFPIGRSDFTQERGKTLRRIFRLKKKSLIANRALRDSWMHHDERLDLAVMENRFRSGQLFKRSSDLPGTEKKSYLRIVDVDTLTVFYQDRDGRSQSASLPELRRTLVELENRRHDAFDELPMPADAES